MSRTKDPAGTPSPQLTATQSAAYAILPPPVQAALDASAFNWCAHHVAVELGRFTLRPDIADPIRATIEWLNKADQWMHAKVAKPSMSFH